MLLYLYPPTIEAEVIEREQAILDAISELFETTAHLTVFGPGDGRSYSCMEERIIANSYLSEEDWYEDKFGNITPCWLWIGTRNADGYPHMAIRDKKRKIARKMLAHRESVKAFKGVRLWKSRVVKHLCNNPLCVAPLHLQAGTQSSNIRQSVRDGRHNSQRYKKAA